MENEANKQFPVVRTINEPYYDNSLNIYVTENNIPVQTVHITNIPARITKNILKTYFEKFGKVLSVSISRIREKDSYGFVTFKEAEVAACAILTEHRTRGFKHIKVKPAKSWIQPDVNKVNANRKTYERNDDNNDKNINSILNLNDDCLFHIASFLADYDLVTLSAVCQRFKNIADIVFKTKKYLDMNLLVDCSPIQKRLILSKVGPYVTHVRCANIRGEMPRKRCVDFIPKYCSGIEHLDFINMPAMHVYVYEKMFFTFKQLTTLILQNCGITDEVCKLLFNCKNLKNINLSENYGISGKYLNKLHNLKDLNLKHCANLKPLHFIALCKSNKLKVLNIDGCDLLNKASLDNLSNLQTELEMLSVSNSYRTMELTPITKLRKLKCLEIKCNDDICYDFFEELAKSQSTRLQRLEINHATLDQNLRKALYSFEKLEDLRIPCSKKIDDIFLSKIASKAPLTYFCCAGCHSISKDGILKLITKSSTIKVIDISSCLQFYPDLILSTIDVLKTLNRQSQLKLIVGNTNITESIQENPKFIENCKLFKLVFEITDLGIEFKDAFPYYSDSPSPDDAIDVIDVIGDTDDTDDTYDTYETYDTDDTDYSIL